MHKRSWLPLLLILPLMLVPPAAQAQPRYVPEMPSHRELPGGLDVDTGQAMMAERLKQLHELHQLQDQVQDLLKDPDFRNNLRNQFSEEQLRQLREKILRGDGLSRDGNWNKLLNQAVSGRKMDERQIDVLRRWAERMDRQRMTAPSGPSLLPNRPAPAPSSPSSATPSTPEATATLTPPEGESLWDRFQGNVSDWFARHADDFGADVVSVLNELGAGDEGGPLADLLRSMKTPESGESWAERAAGLSEYLPDVAGFLHEQGGAWDEVRSIFQNAPMPSLPETNLAAPSGGPSADGEGWGTSSLVLLGLGVFLLLLWKTIRTPAAKAEGDEDAPWRLGAWPVAPDAVSTREDVIRAFEHLALLRLGPDAATHHHRDLAARLADCDGGGPARRQAADLLAWLYELARYTPAEAPFSTDELSEARHALRFLAGVTTA